MSDQTNSSSSTYSDAAPSCGQSGGDNNVCNPQITDSVTQSSVHTLALGPAVAAVNSYLGQAQAQTILFANMVNQQAQYATVAATSLTQELTQLFSLHDSQ